MINLIKVNEEKSKVSPFKVGDKVMCFWGSSGYDQEGIIVDPLVNYNGYMEFTEENCEPACIVRLINPKLPTGCLTELNEVIPHRQIKKVEDVK